MPRLVSKFKYMKPGAGGKSIGGYAKYIATREGVEKLDDSQRYAPATAKQEQLIRRILREFPDAKQSHEYQDYQKEKTVGNASEFIIRTLEENMDQVADSKTYADYTYAVMCMSYGDYGTAMVCFQACGDFLDSADLLYGAKYNYAMDVYGERDYARLPEVIGLFESLGGYLDSASMLEGARSQYREHAIYTYNGGDKAAALAMFEFLAGYSDCDSWAQTIRSELA